MFYEEVNTDEEIITPDQLIEFANHWTQAGANIISGCCGLGPDHTQALCNLKQTISIPSKLGIHNDCSAPLYSYSDIG